MSRIPKRPQKSSIPQHTPPLRPQTAARPATRVAIATRKPAEKSTTPRLGVSPAETRARPTTAKGNRANPGLYVEKKRAEKKREDVDAKFDPNHDYFPDVTKLRKDIEKEFGDPPPKADLAWLDDLEKIHQRLNENVIESSCIDDSPILAFNDAADKVIQEMKPGDSVGATAKKMVDAGFDAIHERMEQESALLKERMELLSKMQHELLEHRCDYAADLEDDDYDKILYAEPEVTIEVRQRPKTAAPQSRRMIRRV